jgi:hypothetical protein
VAHGGGVGGHVCGCVVDTAFLSRSRLWWQLRWDRRRDAAASSKAAAAIRSKKKIVLFRIKDIVG